jgi:UDP-galactopyranose mutase
MGSSKDCVVAGAGFSGCTAARLLAEAGLSVLVVEKSPRIGGHCHDQRNRHGITIHTFGPHIFHTQDAEVWDFVRRFSDFRPYQHRVLSWVEGRLLPFPINIDTLRSLFGPLSGPEEVRALLAREVERSTFRTPAVDFRDAVVSQVGERLYGLFFEKYTRKQWGREPEEILPEVARRIPVREDGESRYFTDPYQGIPARGYTALLTEMLRHPKIEVRLGTDWFDQKDSLDAGLTVYTGEMDRFFGYRHGTLPYRSLRFLWRSFRRERFQPAAVVNYPNDHRYTRITEYKHFLGETSEWTTVSYEYPMDGGTPFYIVLTSETVELRKRYLESLADLPGRFILTGRLAEYRYYNMDQAVRAAMDKVRNAIAGKTAG